MKTQTLIAGLCCLLPMIACAQAQKTYRIYGKTMGNKYRVTWVSQPMQGEEVTELQSDINQRLVDINNAMSTWQSDSEISQFNQAKAHQSIEVSPAFGEVLKESLRLHQVTNGALDVTVGPLVKLWGFGPANHLFQIPSRDEVEAIKAYTGVEHLSFNGIELSKDHDQTELDFSAIAKGFGVDQVAEVLQQHGISRYLVDIGGEVVGKGSNPDGKPWQLQVEKPTIYIAGLSETIPVTDMAVATSGDYRNYFTKGGNRYSHVVNPISGQSVETRIASATVIAERCATADGLATAAMVMGIKPTLVLAEEQSLAVMLIENRFDRYVVHKSTAYDQLLKSHPAETLKNTPKGE
ncbi:FAD:protein FMN transferase [Ferrimonas aestuarii]|uniref:FAD:protein FMN transferase n=1 Tax=Ferrimonas aestuarii TaxID=2569539 RepID=A0A4U1BLX3_9GAMM|nr:FAD:protein FMN transferase [Ferrimonas aestuarii]TKB54312.1 FAD:protein FMN transferase [Ferrimonas aestuarii]